jgi:hypothetical protein
MLKIRLPCPNRSDKIHNPQKQNDLADCEDGGDNKVEHKKDNDP